MIRTFLIDQDQIEVIHHEKQPILPTTPYPLETNVKNTIKRKEKLDGFTINIGAEANEEGILFGSIGPYEVEKELVEKGQEVQRKEIRMPDGAIKQTGEYSITIHLGIDTDATINLIVETNNQS